MLGSAVRLGVMFNRDVRVLVHVNVVASRDEWAKRVTCPHWLRPLLPLPVHQFLHPYREEVNKVESQVVAHPELQALTKPDEAER